MNHKLTWKFTVKVNRNYTALIRDGLTLEEIRDGSNLEKLQTNIQKANDYLLQELYGITPEDAENMEQHEYDKLLAEIEEIKDPKVQKD